MWFSRLSIRNKLLTVLIAGFVFLITLGVIGIHRVISSALNDEQKSSLTIIGNLAAEAVRMGVEFGDSEMVAKAMESFTKGDQISLIEVTDATGKQFFYYRNPKFPQANFPALDGFKKLKNEVLVGLPILADNKKIGHVLLGFPLEKTNIVLSKATRMLLLMSVLGLIAIVIFVSYVSGFFTKTLKYLQRMAVELSKGKVNFHNPYKYEDELGDLIKAFQTMARSVSEKAQIARHLAAGEVNAEIELLSDEDVLGQALVEVQKSLQTIVSELETLVDKHKNGQVDARANVHDLQGAYRDVITNLNEALDVIVNPLKQTIKILNEYASGNLEHQLEPLPGQLMQLTEALNTIRTNLQALVEESVRLTEQAKAGNLSYRGDVERFEGGYRAILRGFNEAMDAIIRPLNESAQAIAAISRGEVPPPIESEFKGDFNTLKENINRSIDAINLLVRDTNALIEGALEGRLSLRVDDSKHQGDFRKIVRGINESLDALTFPMNEILEALEKISTGDLTAKINSEHKGDHGRMKDALNKTLDALNNTLAGIAASVEQIRNGAQQVADSSQSVSQGASEQASALEQTTASIEEIAQQAKHNSEHAQHAKQISSTAREAADEGSALMQQMLEAMQAINDSSNQISKIIKVIDEIAFQTNLLSLNAAVEAARAGVHGKGFAVVAEEVRNLAQRSARAAKETEQLIEGSVEKIRRGTELADKTAQSLESIVQSMIKSNDLIDEIASASAEQVQGIEQISESLRQVDQVTQANAASAEQSASAAEELSSQATNLQRLVAKFRLENFTFAPEAHEEDYAFAYERVSHRLAAQSVHGNGHNGNGKSLLADEEDDRDFGDF